MAEFGKRGLAQRSSPQSIVDGRGSVCKEERQAQTRPDLRQFDLTASCRGRERSPTGKAVDRLDADHMVGQSSHFIRDRH